MKAIATARLLEERKMWRKDHPVGFHAQPQTLQDGTINLFQWICAIPGKEGTSWEGGLYPLTIHFSEEYPAEPPRCAFDTGFFHPNIYPSGTVCLSILRADDGWKPSISIKMILLGISDLLCNPNEKSPAQSNALMMYNASDPSKFLYNREVKAQAKKYAKEKFKFEKLQG